MDDCWCVADGACDVVAPTEQMERVAPLREFTLPHRDPRYDSVLLQCVIHLSRFHHYFL